MFGAHVSADQVYELVRSGNEPKLGGCEAEVSPFFASVDSYVSIAEQISLAQLQEVMNAWFEIGTRAIQAQGGMIDKFVGDAIVAMFGAPPLPMSDHALKACVAALECQKRVAELRGDFGAMKGDGPNMSGNCACESALTPAV